MLLLEDCTNIDENAIFELMQFDSKIQHVRLNIVNGCDNLYFNYNETLSPLLEDDRFSIVHYRNIREINDDLFDRLNELNKRWLNVFVYNVNTCSDGCVNKSCIHHKEGKCINPHSCFSSKSNGSVDQLLSQLTTINESIKWAHKYINMDNYTHTLVSTLDERFIKNVLRNVNDCMKSVDLLKYINYNDYKTELLTLIYMALKVRSDFMKQRWVRALQKARVALI